MTIQSAVLSKQFEENSANLLEQYGIRLEKGWDFKRYQEIVQAARPGYLIGDPFNCKLNTLNQENALWTIGRNRAGQVVHTQALRLLSLETRSLADYFQSNFRRFSPPGMNIDFTRSAYRPGPGAKKARGKIVYSGETWISDAMPELRGSGMAALFVRLAMLDTLRYFGADYMSGFMTEKTIYKGVGMRMGFMHAEPFALQWYQVGKPDPMEGVMVYMSADDIRFLLDLPEGEFTSLAA